MIESVILGAALGLLATVLAGVRRFPWRYSGLVGLGYGLVLGALRLAIVDTTEPGLLVLLGAVGGSVAMLGHERGERARAR